LANVYRHHNTKGAQAMAVALAYPSPTPYKCGGSNVDGAHIARDQLSRARVVVAYRTA
jgi:hypothetical protein